MSPITTHVLDLSSGQPARGVGVTLAREHGGRWDELAHRATDADGRIRDLLADTTPLAVGTYRLEFATFAYFEARGLASFHPSVVICFRVDDPGAHFHVPLLLSPFGYSTYRGS